MVLSPPAIFLSSSSAKLIGEFTSLEEPSDDSDIATVLGSLADGSEGYLHFVDLRIAVG
jgi:hypothetical protein